MSNFYFKVQLKSQYTMAWHPVGDLGVVCLGTVGKGPNLATNFVCGVPKHTLLSSPLYFLIFPFLHSSSFL